MHNLIGRYRNASPNSLWWLTLRVTLSPLDVQQVMEGYLRCTGKRHPESIR